MNNGQFQIGINRLSKVSEGLTDRVPFTAQMQDFSMKCAGVTSGDFYSDARKLVSSIINTAIDFDFDFPCIGYDVYNIELEALGQVLKYRENTSPQIDEMNPLIRCREDLYKLRQPEPGKSGRMAFVIDIHRTLFEETGITPTIQFCAPFSMGSMARTYSCFIQDIYDDPSYVHETLQYFTENVIAPWIEYQIQVFPQAKLAVGADALCSPPMVTKEIIEEFSIPYILKLRELCSIDIAVVNWWGDSVFNPVNEFLQLKRRVSVGKIRAQDPDVAKLGVKPFKEFASKYDLTLEIGVGSILNKGSTDMIKDLIKSYIDQGAPGGKFIVYLTNLDADTPPVNVKAAVEAIKEFGIY